MVEQTAILLGNARVPESSYVGHFTLLGTPRTARGFGSASHFGRGEHYAASRGVEIGEKVTIGNHVIVGDGSAIDARAFLGDRVTVGHDTRIGADSELYFGCQIHDRAQIGESAWICGFVCNDAVVESGAVVFGSLVHRFTDATRGLPERPPSIGRDAFVGIGAVVVGGIQVGDAAYVAAGSVLIEDAQPGCLYAGNPARNMGVAPEPFRSREGRCEHPAAG